MTLNLVLTFILAHLKLSVSGVIYSLEDVSAMSRLFQIAAHDLDVLLLDTPVRLKSAGSIFLQDIKLVNDLSHWKLKFFNNVSVN
jgi:hypothetical protein